MIFEYDTGREVAMLRRNHEFTNLRIYGMTLEGETLSGVVSLYRGGEAEMSLHIAHTLGEKVRKNIVLGL